MTSFVSSSSSLCSNGSSKMNSSSSSYLIKEGASMELSDQFISGGEGAQASIGSPSPSPSPAPSMFSFNLSNTPPRDPLYPSSPLDGFSPGVSPHQHAPATHSKESVCVTVRFRPLSSREIQRGDEVAWYADGDTIVRSEYNPITAYAFDRVFGPATTTRGIYDVAAQNVVRGAMEGVNGTVFAYGVTSSGKTYTMHGDPKSPGIIPLAVKHIFSIIQETPDREYLLRVSYLEIYNEVINDLLDPAGQNLRIREDSQGTYVEGIKEEVVLSPVHALSLIAAGEELRHVGSNNYNLVSSRSHTVFTLTIESSPRSSDPYDDVDEVTISQLNLIDLAGSESSKTETTGQRRKEGSYINKSLLTLGTVIGKLSEGRASHVPYRDSKLTRLLQSSLCGYGRVSLICTLTPASSNMEETHNTLKFAQRAKRVTIQATSNRIIDDRSLIRIYQKEILSLKEELDQLKREQLMLNGSPHEDCISQREQLEAGHMELLSRLEEEEQAKAALLGRIQRLTKLILVSSKTNTRSQALNFGHRRRHSFGAEKNYENFDSGIFPNGLFTPVQLDIKKRSMAGQGALHIQNSDQGSIQGQHWPKLSQRRENMTEERDLLRGQLKMQAGEVANYMRSLRSLSEEALTNPDDLQLQVEMEQTKAVIQEKEGQLQVLEQQIIKNVLVAMENASPNEMCKIISGLICQLNQKECEFEIKAVDFKLVQEELQAKLLEINKLQTALTLEQHWRYDMMLEDSIIPKTCDTRLTKTCLKQSTSAQLKGGGLANRTILNDDFKARRAEADCSDSESYSSKGSSHFVSKSSRMRNQMLMQAAEIESLKQEKVRLQEENGGLQIQSQKLAEEASYAKELASAAAVELRNLAQEVTKLSFQNSKLANDLSLAQKDGSLQKQGNHSVADGLHTNMTACMQRGNLSGFRDDDTDSVDDIVSWKLDPEDFKRELFARKERERCLESALADKEQVETELRKKLEEGKKREADLENDLAGMWVQLAMLRKEKGATDYLDSDVSSIESCGSFIRKDAEDKPFSGAHQPQKESATNDLQTNLEEEKQKTAHLQILVSQLKSEELEGLQLLELEELQKVHVEALTKLFQAKAKCQDKERQHESLAHADQQDDDRNSHICKICFEAPTAAVLLPCRHFCLCKPCAVACTECPLCRSGIADRIITFTS